MIASKKNSDGEKNEAQRLAKTIVMSYYIRIIIIVRPAMRVMKTIWWVWRRRRLTDNNGRLLYYILS